MPRTIHLPASKEEAAQADSQVRSNMVSAMLLISMFSLLILLFMFADTRSHYPDSIHAIKVVRDGISSLRPAHLDSTEFPATQLTSACLAVRNLQADASRQSRFFGGMDAQVAQIVGQFVEQCDALAKLSAAKDGLDARVAYEAAGKLEATAGSFTTYENPFWKRSALEH